MRARSSSRALLLGALLLLALPGCQKGQPAPVDVAPPGRYPDGAAGLEQLFRDVLAACQKDDRQRVHDLLASTMMTQAELSALLGPERGAALWPRYESLLASLANIGAMELVAQVYEKKYDDIAVVRVDELPEAEQQATDRNVLAAMVRRAPLYTVRVKRKSEPRGLRYDFFVYQGGRWRTGNLLGKYLGPEAPAPGAAPPAGPPPGPAPATAPAAAPVKKKG